MLSLILSGLGDSDNYLTGGFICLGEQYERKAEKMGTGKVVFEKDQKQRKIKYKKFTDDGVKKLHEARFAPLPTGDPQTWADQVPVKRDQVMKNL